MISMNLKTHTNTTRKHLLLKKKMGVVILHLQLVVRYSNLQFCVWKKTTHFGICLGNLFLVGCNFKSRDYFQHFFQFKVVISQKKEKCFQITTTTKRNCSLSRKKNFWWSCFFLLHLHPMIVWRQPRPLFSQQQITPPLNILAH